MSCVLVPRNRQWFKQNIGTIGELWKTILKERQDGFEHRAPNKRFKKTDENNITNSSTIIKLDSNTNNTNTNINSNSSLFKFLQLNLNLNVKKLD